MKSHSKLPKAAHFLLIPELLYSPPNRAIIEALLDKGFQVHIFGPGLQQDTTDYGTFVHCHQVSYTNRWLISNMFRPFWWSIRCFSGTSEDPLAIVGALSRLYRRPLFVLADEIKAGSYRGDRSERWKHQCKLAMQRADFNIVNDESRIDLLREYVPLSPRAKVIVYPGCFHDPPKSGSEVRSSLRAKWNMPKEALIIAASGGFNLTAGADWLIRSLKELDSLHAVIQPLGVNPLSLFLIQQLDMGSRLYLQEERLSWNDAWRSAVAFDIGMAIYTNQAPQFQRMGISSNRLCMFIAMGVPVICSRQASFRFVEDYQCGVLVTNYREFIDSIRYIEKNLQVMRENCKQCFREYIMPPSRYSTLKSAIASLK